MPKQYNHPWIANAIRETVDLEQGSPEWIKFRLAHKGASEAGAVLGLSKNLMRNDLLKMKATGTEREFSDFVQKRILDKGHEIEAMTRPIVEDMIGMDLYPTVWRYGNLSASCDGIDMTDMYGWENKQYNEDYFEMVQLGVVPEEHMPQVQQCLLVTGAKQWFFTVSDGTPEKTAGVWVLPDHDWFDRIIDGWIQFDKDLVNYAPASIVERPKAEVVDSLPDVIVQARGELTTCNLKEIKPIFDEFLANTPRSGFRSDEDFALAKGNAKAARNAAAKCGEAEEQAISGMMTVSEVIAELRDYKKRFNELGLALEKAVKKEEDNIRKVAKQERMNSYAEHIKALNKTIFPIELEISGDDKPDFDKAMKNQRLLSSLYNKLDTELAQAKIAADKVAADIRDKLDWYNEIAADHKFLFEGVSQSIMYKPKEDFQLIVTTRIEKHKQEEAKRMEEKMAAEREKIRLEEEAKAAQKLKAAQAAEDARLKKEQEAIEIDAKITQQAQDKIRAEKADREASERIAAFTAKVPIKPAPAKRDDNKEGTITIARRDYEQLKQDADLLRCLMECGVDNWEGYDDAIALHRNATVA